MPTLHSKVMGLRMAEVDAALLERAARFRGMTPSEFMRRAVGKQVTRTLEAEARKEVEDARSVPSAGAHK
jgi:uncharacterized protein (DUF1778 family)